ncbi:hypothetical protein ACLEEO_02585 [Lonsdalea quercina]
MKRNCMFSNIAVTFLVIQLSGCTSVGMHVINKVKSPPSNEVIKKGFSESMNISPEKITISNIQEYEGNETGITGPGVQKFTFDAAISGKTKNCSLTRLVNNDIYYTGCTEKNAAVKSW